MLQLVTRGYIINTPAVHHRLIFDLALLLSGCLLRNPITLYGLFNYYKLLPSILGVGACSYSISSLKPPPLVYLKQQLARALLLLEAFQTQRHCPHEQRGVTQSNFVPSRLVLMPNACSHQSSLAHPG
jgi:hypothetical protein